MSEILLFVIVYFPVFAVLPGVLFSRPRPILLWVAAVVCVDAAVAIYLAVSVFANGPASSSRAYLYMDSLSAYHLVIMMLVFAFSSIYAVGYCLTEYNQGKFKIFQIRQYAVLWAAAISSMILVLISNNLAIMWVGIEGTTLLTSFLISLHLSKSSVEAMWKYLILCSVGVGLAFIGVLFAAVSVRDLNLPVYDSMMWTILRDNAKSLNPVTMKAGFIFALIGYGTKAGLAPMHNWLPDAHSQAPAPVSAMFSGFMLNTALYCVMRYLPLVEGATGHQGWGLDLLKILGLLSIIVAAGFIIYQHDVKRLLAYHSIEHLGIIALGLGIGGIGTFAALFHTFNHSICKTYSFFAAGKLGQIYDTHEIEKISGAVTISPAWGIGLLASILSLIGVAPFAIFMSEFQLMRATVSSGAYCSLIIFILGSLVIFVGALQHAISMAWGKPTSGIRQQDSGLMDWGFLVIFMGGLLVIGCYMPTFFREAINQAALVVGGSGQ